MRELDIRSFLPYSAAHSAVGETYEVEISGERFLFECSNKDWKGKRDPYWELIAYVREDYV